MTVENFRKAMEKADVVLLKKTELNLQKHNDPERLAIVKELLAGKEKEVNSGKKNK